MIKTQTKLITGYENGGTLDKEINSWINQHPDYYVYDIKFTHTATHDNNERDFYDDMQYFSALLLYKVAD